MLQFFYGGYQEFTWRVRFSDGPIAVLFCLMPIAYLTLELRIEGAHSLKDKRQVLRSMKDRLRHSFNISIAEIEVTDLWQRATLGVVSISGSRDYLEGLMRNVEREAVKLANNAGAEVVDSFLDFVEEFGDRAGPP